MTNDLKITTADVDEILDTKIKATTAYTQLNVNVGDSYDTVLGNIAARTPTLLEKQGLDAAVSPSTSNPFITQNDLTVNLTSKIPWKTIGQPGSGADFEGNTDAVFTTAFASGAPWIQIREGTYTFSNTVTIPASTRVVGDSPNATVITGSLSAPLFSLLGNSYLSYLSVTQAGSGAAIEIDGSSSSLENLIITATASGLTSSSQAQLSIFTCAFVTSGLSFSSVTDSFIHACLFNTPSVNGLSLQACTDISVTSSIFQHGVFAVANSEYVRAVANHFNDGTSLSSNTNLLLRANTPDTYNNEADDFADLLAYIGSPSILSSTPAYSNNYAGPPGEDLTSRASGLDLLIQWRYEERNFHLVAETEPTTITWNPTTNALTSSGNIHLVSAHRESYWLLAPISVSLPSGSALYYVLDRTLASSPVTLAPLVAPIGSIPNNSSNRQVWVLAYALNTTCWWRGGGGSRFPGTGGVTGTYFVDGSSQSLLTYIGATDYNDSEPNYSSNFSGIQGENLVTRINKTDELIQRLFEYTNVGIYLSDAGSIAVTPGPSSTYTVTLSGTVYLAFPQVAGRITATNLTWNLSPGQLVYFTFDQGDLAGSDTPITSSTTVSIGSLPLPDAYPLTTKYFVFATCVGSAVYLWDNTELPLGGLYPVPTGRTVVATTAPATLSSNTQWDGTNFLWEGLSLAVSTGAALADNAFPNQTTASAGLTDLAEGQGLLVTHTWNSGVTGNVTIAKVSVPLVNQLTQTQFLWVQRRNNFIVFLE